MYFKIGLVKRWDRYGMWGRGRGGPVKERVGGGVGRFKT